MALHTGPSGGDARAHRVVIDAQCLLGWPAVNVGISVSRVGSSAQIKAMKQVAGQLRLDIAQYNELASFAQFGSELDKASMAQLNRGKRMVELLKQNQYSPLTAAEQVIVLYAGSHGFFDDIKPEEVRQEETSLLRWLRDSRAELTAAISEKKQLNEELKAEIEKALADFKKTH